MNDLNSVIIQGRLTRDPDFSYTSSSAALCKFHIAVNRKYKASNQTKDEESYFDIEAWNRTAEICSEHLNKGRGVRILGRLKQERWQQNGRNRSKIIIIAEHVEIKPQKQEPITPHKEHSHVLWNNLPLYAEPICQTAFSKFKVESC